MKPEPGGIERAGCNEALLVKSEGQGPAGPHALEEGASLPYKSSVCGGNTHVPESVVYKNSSIHPQKRANQLVTEPQTLRTLSLERCKKLYPS